LSYIQHVPFAAPPAARRINDDDTAPRRAMARLKSRVSQPSTAIHTSAAGWFKYQSAVGS